MPNEPTIATPPLDLFPVSLLTPEQLRVVIERNEARREEVKRQLPAETQKMINDGSMYAGSAVIAHSLVSNFEAMRKR